MGQPNYDEVGHVGPDCHSWLAAYLRVLPVDIHFPELLFNQSCVKREQVRFVKNNEDSYLLQVSRYFRRNPLGAKVQTRICAVRVSGAQKTVVVFRTLRY